MGILAAMTPNEMQILKGLVVVAWADGAVEAPEVKVIDEILDVFGASEDEAREIHEFARTRRLLQDLPLDKLTREDREVLLGNAAVLSHADGAQTRGERKLLTDLIARLQIPADRAKSILDASKDGILMVGSRGLEDE